MIEIKTATDDEKLAFFFDRVCALAKQLGVNAYVMLADMGDNRSSSRYPDCADDCDDPNDCAARIFHVTALEFEGIAKTIRDGTSEVRHSTPKEEA